MRRLQDSILPLFYPLIPSGMMSKTTKAQIYTLTWTSPVRMVRD